MSKEDLTKELSNLLGDINSINQHAVTNTHVHTLVSRAKENIRQALADLK
ncbi:MAG TPA: hypothetical protein QF753_18150 [Victivallales bacterium]|nr:hypothetical protein [Victivallales bacterium]